MAQSIKVDIRGNAGSLLKALKQSETAMRRLQGATKGLAAQDKRTNSAAVGLTSSLQRNAAAMKTRTSATTQNTSATRVNTSANQDLSGSLQRTNIRLGQANAGFYNVAFAMEDAGQFANGFSAGMRAIGNNLSAIALSLSASGASFADFRAFLAGPGGLIIALSAFTAAAQLVPAAMEKMGISFDEAEEKLDSFREGLEEAASSFVQLRTDLAEGFEFDEEQIAKAQEILDQRNEELRLQAISNGLSREQVEDIDDTISSLENKIKLIRAEEFIGLDIRKTQREQAEQQLEIAQSLQRNLAINQSISDEFDGQLERLETNRAIQQGLEGLGGRRVTNEEEVTSQLEQQLVILQRMAQLPVGAFVAQQAILPSGGLRRTPGFELGFDPDEEVKRMDSQMSQLQSSTMSGMTSFAGAILTGEQSVSSAFGSFFSMMGDQLIQLGIANIGLGTAGEALRSFVTNPALAIAAGAALLALGGQLRKRTRKAQTNITSGRGGSISTGSAFVRDPYILSGQRNRFFGGGGASPFNVGYIAPPPPPRNPYAEIRMDAKDFVVSFDDARRELDMVS